MYMYVFCGSVFIYVFMYLFCFLGLHLWHMEVLRLGDKLELQLLAYVTAIQDPSRFCDLHHSSWQCQILNPLSEARDWTGVLMDPSQIHFCWATMGTPQALVFQRNEESPSDEQEHFRMSHDCPASTRNLSVILKVERPESSYVCTQTLCPSLPPFLFPSCLPPSLFFLPSFFPSSVLNHWYAR